MKHFKTYYAVTDSDGRVLTPFGRPRWKPSKWEAVEKERLFDKNQNKGVNWYENQIRERFGGTPTWIRVLWEEADEEKLKAELENERKIQALKKLNPPQRQAVERSEDFEPPREQNDSAIEGNSDRGGRFIGLGVADEHGNFIDQDGSTPGWRWSLIGEPGMGSSGKIFTLESAINRKEKYGSRIVRLFAELEEIEDLDQELQEKADSVAIEKAKMKLDESEIEALGI